MAAGEATARQAQAMSDVELSNMAEDIEEGLKSGALAPASLACGLCAGRLAALPPS
jgi:hypothetical protein